MQFAEATATNRCILFDANVFRAFLPQSIVYVSSIMQCINFSPSTIPVEEYSLEGETRPLYGLNEAFKTKLAIAEFIQRTTINFLTRYLNELPLDLDINRYWHPVQYGYKRWWYTRRSVIIATLQARWAFIVRWTYVAFLACLASKNDVSPTVRPHWVELAIKERQMSENVWNDISQCWVFRSDGKRVGGFVKIWTDTTTGSLERHTMMQWFSYIPLIAKRMHELPLWLVYPWMPAPNNLHELAYRYLPTKAEVKEAQESDQARRDHLDLEMYTPGQNPPSRQDKSWDVYVKQLVLWVLHRHASSIAATTMRADIHDTPTPSGNKAQVYYWEIVRYNGLEYWYVSLVEPAKIKELWEATHPEGRVYNIYTGEWDIRGSIVPENTEGAQPFTYSRQDINMDVNDSSITQPG